MKLSKCCISDYLAIIEATHGVEAWKENALEMVNLMSMINELISVVSRGGFWLTSEEEELILGIKHELNNFVRGENVNE